MDCLCVTTYGIVFVLSALRAIYCVAEDVSFFPKRSTVPPPCRTKLKVSSSLLSKIEQMPDSELAASYKLLYTLHMNTPGFEFADLLDAVDAESDRRAYIDDRVKLNLTTHEDSKVKAKK